MTEFLKSVAKSHIERYGSLEDFLFVFPNKRSGAFFKKYVQDLSGDRYVVAPEITTITDFVCSVSGMEIASRIELLFLLYSIYSEMLSEPVDFNKFRGWGETALSDFNEVDMYMVNAGELFKNLYDFREIRTNYFTKEQIEVLRDYFGVTDFMESTRSFWLHYNNPDLNNEKSGTKKKFIELWKVFGELYTRINESLKSRGLAYSGMAYRLAFERIVSEGESCFRGKRKIVMVGFNALSTVEFRIFKELSKLSVSGSDIKSRESLTDFYWDASGSPMEDSRNSAVYFISRNKKHFPSQLDISDSDSGGIPDVLKLYGAPSNTSQVKIISHLISDIKKRIGNDKILNAKVAVVLPDEGLLLPLLYSLPENIESVNLTIGYSMSMTSTVTFVEFLRILQNRHRIYKDKPHFFYEDILNLLQHPFLQKISSSESIHRLKAVFSREHRYLIDAEVITDMFPELSCLFVPLDNSCSVSEVMAYIDKAIEFISSRINADDNNNGIVKTNLDCTHLELYRDALRRFYNSYRKYNVRLTVGDVFLLVDRLIKGESIRFEGEPLHGLQVMGPLETRAIDFDYIIIASMNERIYPRKLRSRTFIPNALRNGYGIATTRHQESIFAYNFYRMISRAKEVYMIYDARSVGMKSGDISRYIRQLQILYAPGRIKDMYASYIISKNEGTVKIRKTPDVMKSVERYFIPDSGKFLSASAINHYIECPLKFYLTDVRGLKINSDPEEFMEAWVIGTVLHEVLQKIYVGDQSGKFLDKGINITSVWLDTWINDRRTIDKFIREAINRYYYNCPESELDRPLETDGKLYAEIFRKIIIKVLEHDREITPFLFKGAEVKENLRMKLSDGSAVNVKMVIDRIDTACTAHDGKEYEQLRIVDYKSGMVDLKGESIDVFFENSSKKAGFQLMFYSRLLDMYLRDVVKISRPLSVRMEIYDLSNIVSYYKDEEKLISIDRNKIDSNMEIYDEFSSRLDDLILEIKNPDIDFVQTPDSRNCQYCAFRTICQR